MGPNQERPGLRPKLSTILCHRPRRFCRKGQELASSRLAKIPSPYVLDLRSLLGQSAGRLGLISSSASLACLVAGLPGDSGGLQCAKPGDLSAGLRRVARGGEDEIMREGVMMSLSVRDGHGTANSISIVLRHIIPSITRTRTHEGDIFTGNNGVATASRQTNGLRALGKLATQLPLSTPPFSPPSSDKVARPNFRVLGSAYLYYTT